MIWLRGEHVFTNSFQDINSFRTEIWIKNRAITEKETHNMLLFHSNISSTAYFIKSYYLNVVRALCASQNYVTGILFIWERERH